MSLFVLDTAGDTELLTKGAQHTGKYVKAPTRALLDDPKQLLLEATWVDDDDDDQDVDDDDDDFCGLPPLSVDLSPIIAETLAITERKRTKAEEEMDRAAEALAAAVKNAGKHAPTKQRKCIVNLDFSDFNAMTRTFEIDPKLVGTDVAKQMAESKLKPGNEKVNELPPLTKKKQKALNRVERAKTKGADWYNLPATEVTEEIANELKLLQMRSILNPKQFYKKNDLKVLPKYFQIGTVQHSPLDYYSERGTRHKKRSMVDELLADSEAQKYMKRKYKEIVAQKDKYAHRKAMQKMKKLKKNK